MGRDVQNAARGAVRHRDRHAAFAGNEAYIADWRVAIIGGKMAQISANAASHPVADDAILWPVILGIELAGSVHDFFQFAGAFRRAARDASSELCADIGGNVESI